MGRELVILSPVERRDTLLHIIRGARHRLTFSLFRCDDHKVLNELAEARDRGVHAVEQRLLFALQLTRDAGFDELVTCEGRSGLGQGLAGALTLVHATGVGANFRIRPTEQTIVRADVH